MGLNSQSLKILDFSKNLIKEKKILSLGNPYFSRKRLENADLDKKLIEDLFKLERDKRAAYFFKEVYGAKLEILDISEAEGADHIEDLNQIISKPELKEDFDFIIDPGTSEHISNLKQFFQNILYLLKKGGIYFFQSPLNGWIDHGFRQYSPTFFYDLCFANKESLSLMNLFIYHRSNKTLIDLFSFYKCRELKDNLNSNSSIINIPSYALNLYKYTNTYLILLSQSGGYVDNIGMFKKIKNSELNFSFNQQIYRTSSLGTILPNNEKSILKRINKNSLLKNFFLKIPIPNFIKFKIIELYCKFKYK